MYTPALTFVVLLWTKELFVAGNTLINTYVAENGQSYYRTPLYCSYTSLYLVSPYNNMRNTYVMTDNRDCCYLAEFRGKCCVQTDSQGLYQSCKCDPSITCSTTTTPTTTPVSTTIAPTTTPVPTTTAITPLCGSPTFRILYGEKASTDCPNSGVFNITFLNGSRSCCNAVYTLATVYGIFKPTILTAEVCKIFVELFITSDIPLEIHIGSQKYDLLQPNFTVVSGPDGSAFIEVAESLSYILDEVGDCQKNLICPYNEATMKGRVDMTQCKMFSWGSSDSNDLSQNGLNQVSLTINNGGCQDNPDQSSNSTLCFKSQSGKNVMCSNDSGAPVYCKALETEEWILMGVTGLQRECDNTPEITVIPYPG
ncbi:unnamed protein product [Candidula unifasciata]|uniref:Peptidase S1 domain-containing protein n=1 Tax=Candidula unifasciata TaxID=100452 RepID=A0A8S3Z3S3_9EUPU|nr:unnamed protein product [Candidula unifasciata]